MGLHMGSSAHCCVLLCNPYYPDLDSSDFVDAKNGLTCLDWTKDTRNIDWVLKWVLVHTAALCCTMPVSDFMPMDYRNRSD